jgi:hypothetical protein
MTNLITARTRLESHVRDIHLIHTQWAFSVLLYHEHVNAAANGQGGDLPPHHRSSTRPSRPKCEICLIWSPFTTFRRRKSISERTTQKTRANNGGREKRRADRRSINSHTRILFCPTLWVHQIPARNIEDRQVYAQDITKIAVSM